MTKYSCLMLNGNFINFNNTEVTEFFIKYAQDLAENNNNIIYDYYGTETQGVLVPITFQGENLKVVIRYDLTSHGIQTVFANIFIILIVSILSCIYFSHSIIKEIAIVASSMSDIVKNDSSALQKSYRLHQMMKLETLLCLLIKYKV